MADLGHVNKGNCLYFTFMIFLTFINKISSKSLTVITVPYISKPGFEIVKLGCSKSDLQLVTKNGDEFYNNFILNDDGVLLLKTGISEKLGNSYEFSVTSLHNCYDNIPRQRTFRLNVLPVEFVVFPKRVHTGYFKHLSERGTIITKLSKIHVAPILNHEFILQGIYSDHFEVVPNESANEIHVILQKPFPRKFSGHSFSFTLTARNNENVIGHTSLEIFMLDTIKPRRQHIFLSKPSSANDNVVNFDQTITDGSQRTQVLRHRSKRQTITPIKQTLTKPENAQGALFTVESGQAPGTTNFRFEIQSAVPEDIFQVNENNGEVSLKPNAKLNYDYNGPRQHVITIDVKKRDDNSVLQRVEVTLNVGDVNDEPPRFITKPTPYLAVVGNNAPAGTSVFKLLAEDVDGGPVKYFIEGTNEYFEVEQETGWIKTTQSITAGLDYVVNVYALDSTAVTTQRTETVKVSIRRGQRAPQFYSSQYEVFVEESNQADQTGADNIFQAFDSEGNKVPIEAKNFQVGAAITYSVYDSSTSISSQFAIQDGKVKTLQTLDYEKDKHVMELVLRAQDPISGLSSDVKLTVRLVDRNEFTPLFSKSTFTTVVNEDIPIGSSVITVSASDQDSNTVLSYNVTNDLFEVESSGDGRSGIIKVKGELDYDKTFQHVYEFKVIASDNGVNPFARSATARVIISLRNVNDQAPKFEDNLVATLKESAVGGTTVIVVRAVDDDGDGVTYTFTGGSNIYNVFEIQPTTGRITLRPNNNVPSSTDQIILSVTAKDDGTCCPGTQTVIKSSTAQITVNIEDDENKPPDFGACNYAPTVMEEQDPGLSVVQVTATDVNRGLNGKLEYSIVNVKEIDSNKDFKNYFTINSTTGEIFTQEKLDRETQSNKNLFITVKAVDKGSLPLDDYCTFPITIGDINDNDPKFGKSLYESRVLKTAGTGTEVITVKASDADLATNANIQYSLTTNPDELFKINADTGVISVNKGLQTLADSQTVVLVAMAKDGGTPSRSATVNVSITVTPDSGILPPLWNPINAIYTVKESEPVGFTIAKLTATSRVQSGNDPQLSFNLVVNGLLFDRTDKFLLKSQANTVNLTILEVLDYETTKEYTLNLRASGFYGNIPLSSDNYPKIVVEDANDEIPKFLNTDPKTGYIPLNVLENQPIGTPVQSVSAIDRDEEALFKKVTYALQPNGNTESADFTINANTGLISTRRKFDRETQSSYILNVYAMDSAPSSRADTKPAYNTGSALVKVTITDVNDNEPYFDADLYNATVREDAFIGTPIRTVEAKDLDEATFTYSLTGSNLFAVKSGTGEIYVAGNLDYEVEPNVYNVTLIVDDGKFVNQTTVQIFIIDTNDNPPKFDQDTYTIRTLTEETDYSGTGAILTVKATDPDRFRATTIEYSISQDDAVITSLFSIDKTSGSIFLNGKLDRDRPNGRNVYQFNVLAIDEPQADTHLTGYATVQIFPIDENDNGPVFDITTLTGKVEEGSPSNTFVMQIKAEDYDDGVNAQIEYSIELGSQSPGDAFKIDKDNGEVRTTVGNLDRETNPVYTFKVIAVDKGTVPQTTTATATVSIKDINDNRPSFEQKIYKVSIPETHEGVILRIKATDLDIDDNLRYSLIGSGDSKHFLITEEGRVGRLEVYTKPDYEKESERAFNLTVEVSDSKNTDVAYIEITITDVNDEVPIFDPQKHTTRQKEDIAVDTLLATFTATDRDRGINGELDYFISRKPRDERPDYYFKIDSAGQVRLRNPLDRETLAEHVVKILAIDRGNPPNTGTATLIVQVEDINDEDPRFKGGSLVKVKENSPPHQVAVLEGVDPDGPPFGAPFTFAPVCANSICEKFSLTFDRNGDGGNGTATLNARVRFNREDREYYYLPVVMTDMRDHPDQATLGRTATNTLTIQISDENDEEHFGGHQEMNVYNYKGLFGDIDIGLVSYIDADDLDNDRKDKRFALIGNAEAKTYFQVDEMTGTVRMRKNVPSSRAAGYRLQVEVRDTVFMTQKTVTSTVTVHITDLPAEAPFKSGSIRLTGTSPEEFIKKPANGDSAYTKFRTRLQEKMKLPSIDNVQIISVLDSKVDGVDYTDVRYAAFGSPYFQASQLDGVVGQYRNEFQSDLDSGVKIAMVGIDMCYREICEGGGCNNNLQVFDEPNMVTTQGQSIVGVKTSVSAECACTIGTNVKDCTPNYCLNQGTCQKDDWGVLSCQCKTGFDGPRCQVTKQGFNGTGYAMYKPLQQCENSLTSIEFITTVANGLLLYSGPVQDISNTDPQDFMYLQLNNGYPQLAIDHGSGSVTLSLNGRDSQGNLRMAALNDSNWHKIDIRRQAKYVTLTVDHCISAENQDGKAQDRSPCEKSSSTKGENTFLNVNAPLQLGGRYSTPTLPAGVSSSKFKGCVRNLRHNGELYDLYSKNFFPGSQDGCPEEEKACRTSANLPKKCGENGKCELVSLPSTTRCVCNPGYRGNQCQTATTIKDLQSSSYMDWELQKQFNDSLTSRKMDVQLRYRTRDPDGLLFHVTGTGTGEFIKLEIVENTLQVLYNLGDGNKVLQMKNVSASDGQWHTLYFQRRGKTIVLSRDGQEGLQYVETLGEPDSLHQDLTVKGSEIYAGAEVSYEHSKQIDVTNSKDLENSCLNDIRLETKWFPMTSAENSNNTDIRLTADFNTKLQCVRNDCLGNNCATFGKVCKPLWGLFECVCPTHYQEKGTRCEFINYCLRDSPCHHLATCIPDENNKEYGYRCKCAEGSNMSGRLCNVYKEPRVADAGSDAWIIILAVCLVIVLIAAAVALFLAYMRCKKAADEEGMLDYEKEDYDIRENVVDYDEDGAGEDDHEGYDINRLLKPADMTRMDKPVMEHPLGSRPKVDPSKGHIGDFIHDRLDDANEDDDAPPHDTLRDFQYEGNGSDAGSLSSLNTSSSGGDQDYDFLNEWGPKFSKLADMYNTHNEDSD